MALTAHERVTRSRVKRYGVRDALKAAGKGMKVRVTRQDDGSLQILFISTDAVEERLKQCCEDYGGDYNGLLERVAFYACEEYVKDRRAMLGGLKIN